MRKISAEHVVFFVFLFLRAVSLVVLGYYARYYLKWDWDIFEKGKIPKLLLWDFLYSVTQQ